MQIQNDRFFRFNRYFTDTGGSRRKKRWAYRSLVTRTQNQHGAIFCFSFYANFHFNGHFRHFGRPYWIEEINGKRWFAIANNAIR